MSSNPHQPPENWEAALGRALKNLPERPAPAALLPSVMAQIRAREAAQLAPDRSWWRWPLWLRVASAVAFIALMALLVCLGGHFWENSLLPLLQHWSATAQTVLASLGSAAEAIFRTGSGSGQAMLRWVFVGFSLILLATYFTCIGLGTFIYRTVRK
jgi:hypothetical protein